MLFSFTELDVYVATMFWQACFSIFWIFKAVSVILMKMIKFLPVNFTFLDYSNTLL